MCMVCQVIYSTTAGATLLATASMPMQSGVSQLTKLQEVPEAVSVFTPPSFEKKPGWYEKQVAAERNVRPTSRAVTPRSQVVTYSIATKGVTSANLGEFAAQVDQTLNDGRGWARMGTSFQQVETGGDFNLVLSEASQVPTFSSACSVEWSCRVGVSVIINDARWIGATDAWNGAGGSLRDYRHMVVNHEVGHWLGHGHLNCPGAGQPAPVMQQQSIDLQSCAFNPWPLESELWSSQLGIQ